MASQRPLAARNPSNDGIAIAGFILSALSLLVSLVPICGNVIAFISLALSLIGRSSSRYQRLASSGVGLSIIALAVSIAVLLGYGPWQFVAPYQHIYFDF
jgi:hypothetical protein